MKKVIFLISFSLLLSNCGQNIENEDSNIPIQNNLEALKAKKDQLTEEINAVNLELNKVNTAIEKMTVNEKRVLITALALKATNFEHAIDIQANIKTRQNLELYP